MRRVPELDGLRAVAVLLVIGCHYPGFAKLAGGLPEFGWIGVEIFFVLSGYLITTILLRLRDQPSPYWTFYGRRVTRIFPLYILVTLFIFVVAAWTHASEILNQAYVLKQLFFLQSLDTRPLPFALAALHHLPSNLLHLPSLWFNAGHLPPIWVGMPAILSAPSATFWSLSIEEYFYLLWAPVVLRMPRGWIAPIAGFVCIGEMLLRWITGQSVWYFSQFSIYYHVDPLLYGALLALLLAYWSRTGIPDWATSCFHVMLAVSVLAVASALWLVRPFLGRELRASTLIIVLAMPAFDIGVGCVIGLLSLHSGKGALWMRLLRSPLMQSLGVISYAIYMTHILVAALVRSLAFRLNAANRFLFVQAVFSFVLTVIVARASWHWLEKPLLRWKDNAFPRQAHPPEPVLD